jgi:hypothetical protein
MFKISIVEAGRRRRMVLEGTLVPPWTTEVERVWRDSREHLQGRKMIIDLRNVTLISHEGESTLLGLMRDGAIFSCRDVLTKHVLKRLARQCRCTT